MTMISSLRVRELEPWLESTVVPSGTSRKRLSYTRDYRLTVSDTGVTYNATTMDLFKDLRNPICQPT